MNRTYRTMKRFSLLLLLCLASCSREPAKPTPPPYDADLRDGSVAFWQGGLLVKPILKHTDSDLTHAAIVLYNGKEPFVYEAVPPRVHKVPLAEFAGWGFRWKHGPIHIGQCSEPIARKAAPCS